EISQAGARIFCRGNQKSFAERSTKIDVIRTPIRRNLNCDDSLAVGPEPHGGGGDELEIAVKGVRTKNAPWATLCFWRANSVTENLQLMARYSVSVPDRSAKFWRELARV